MFVHGWIDSINKKFGGHLKFKGEKLLIYDDSANFGTSSYISLPVRNKV